MLKILDQKRKTEIALNDMNPTAYMPAYVTTEILDEDNSGHVMLMTFLIPMIVMTPDFFSMN